MKNTNFLRHLLESFGDLGQNTVNKILEDKQDLDRLDPLTKVVLAAYEDNENVEDIENNLNYAISELTRVRNNISTYVEIQVEPFN